MLFNWVETCVNDLPNIQPRERKPKMLDSLTGIITQSFAFWQHMSKHPRCIVRIGININHRNINSNQVFSQQVISWTFGSCFILCHLAFYSLSLGAVLFFVIFPAFFFCAFEFMFLFRHLFFCPHCHIVSLILCFCLPLYPSFLMSPCFFSIFIHLKPNTDSRIKSLIPPVRCDTQIGYQFVAFTQRLSTCLLPRTLIFKSVGGLFWQCPRFSICFNL